MSIQIHLETVVGDFLKGWAINRLSPDTRVDVEVFAGRTRLGSVVAELPRNDLGSVEHPTPHIGFRFVLPASLLTGDEHEFTARATTTDAKSVSTTKNLLTTKFAFATPVGKPWVESVDNTPEVFEHNDAEMKTAVAIMTEGNITEATEISRRRFRADPMLFVEDTQLVEAISRHAKVKTFEEIMNDRHNAWFEREKDRPWQSALAKKAEMHRFAYRNLVNIPRQIAELKQPGDLRNVDLPHRYVAKPDGLASGKGVFAVSRGRNAFTGKPITIDRIIDNWERLASGTDRIERYIVEEFVADRFAPHSDVIPLDYKIYVFNGVAGFLEVFDRNYPTPSRTPYSVTWRPLPEPLEIGRKLGPLIRRPDNLDELLRVAERLGGELGTFCRVDLFNTPNGPVLGEITILPANGKNRSEYANRITQQAYIVFEEQNLWEK